MKKLSKKQYGVFTPLTSKGWADYTLLDSGNKRKLERFGKLLLIRYEPDAIWKPALPKTDWDKADAEYKIDKKNGKWIIRHQFEKDWMLRVDELSISLKILQSRHIGIFPEQIENWRWMQKKILAEKRPIKILNIFAYSGVASLYCAKAKAQVTHVDASRSAIEMGKKSHGLSFLSEVPIRWIVDDVRKFMLREIRRGNRYDAIIMDPPKFGRGPNGEVWKFENSIDDLFSISAQLLSDQPLFFLLTAYNILLKDELLANKISYLMKNHSGKIEYGPLIQLEQSAGRKIEQSHYVRWFKN